MLNISPQELLLILLVALLVVGPRRLPELGRSLGKGIRELRKAQDEVRKTIQINMDEEPPPARRPAILPDASSAEDGDVAAHADPGAVSGVDVAPAAAAGANNVSEVSRSLGRGLSELRRARKEIQRTFRVDLNEPRPTRPAETPRPTRPAETPEPAEDVTGGPAAGSPPEEVAGGPAAGSPPE
ncbi:MAG: twin-arginine translocase TatA/TatE family subunit [Actinomycetota bacterium]